MAMLLGTMGRSELSRADGFRGRTLF